MSALGVCALSWGVCAWSGVCVPGPGGVCSRGMCAWSRGCLVLGGVPGRGVPGGDPPGTATAADGTHPTGMHSC